MKTATILLACLCTGCSMTPTQQKWVGIGATVVITGAIIARDADRGNFGAPVAAATEKGACTVANPCIPRGK